MPALAARGPHSSICSHSLSPLSPCAVAAHNRRQPPRRHRSTLALSPRATLALSPRATLALSPRARTGITGFTAKPTHRSIELTMDPLNGGEEEAEQRSSKVEDKQRKKKEMMKMKRKLLEEMKSLKNKGVCYLSRVPPKMDPLKLRQHLAQFGEILRLYLTPEDPNATLQRKKAGGFRGKEFSEGWVEFADKHVAKRVANMLNGEQIGGKKRSQFYYDLWNIKYLSKFKWDDLTDEVAYKKGVREQKLVMELSAAKKERDFYLSKVEKSRALNAIDERMKKKQKLQQESGSNTQNLADQHEARPKMVRLMPQTKPVADISRQSKPRLSRDVLTEVFNS